MIISENELSNQRKPALLAGLSLLIMLMASIFSPGFVHGSLIVQGDASTTFTNIMSSEILFKVGIFGWLMILLTDILVTWGFYVYLKPINKSLSLLGALFRLIYTVILAIAILNLLFILILTNTSEYLSLFTTQQLQVLVMFFLDAFEAIWNMGLIIFGGHLLIVGFLAFKSGNIPKVISSLLLIASIGYIIIHLFLTFLIQFEDFITILKYIFTIPMILGELGFGVWLILKGGKVSIKG